MNIIDALGSWSLHGGPLYRKLASALEAAIAAGHIPPGTALPAERSLARQLAVGRSTVVAAYDLLRATGSLESRQGSGTWVAGAARNTRGTSTPQESLQGAALAGAQSVMDLATASMPAVPQVAEAVEAIRGELLDSLLSTTGYSAFGLLELRHAIADHLTADGVPTTPEQVLVTTGDQQALSLICGLVLNAGDVAVVEDPTTPGILDLLWDAAVTVRSSRSVAAAGAAPLTDTIRKANPSLIYLLPTLGPEGRVAAEEDLRAVATSLRDFTGVVIEDTSSRFLVTSGRPSLLTQLAPTVDVVTVGSMSKVFWGGLRIGWIRAGENMIHRLARVKARADLGTPLISQLVSAWLLERAEEVAQDRTRELEQRHAAAADLITRHLPEFVLEHADGGLAVWVRMPRGASRPFAEVARRHGVAVVAGSALSAGGAGDSCLRLALGPSPEAFAAGVALLGRAWTAYDRPTVRPRDLEGPVLV